MPSLVLKFDHKWSLVFLENILKLYVVLNVFGYGSSPINGFERAEATLKNLKIIEHTFVINYQIF